MPENLNHYRTGLYLSIVVALTNSVVCGLSVFLRPQNIRDAVGLCALSLAIPAGLWLGSHFVRFAGAVFLVLWGVFFFGLGFRLGPSSDWGNYRWRWFLGFQPF